MEGYFKENLIDLNDNNSNYIINKEINDLHNKLKMADSRLNTMMKLTEERIDSLESKRENVYRESESLRNNKFKSVMDNFEGKCKEQEAQIKSLNDKANEVYNLISTGGMTGKYQENATRETNTAIVWEIISVLSFLGLIVFSICNYYINNGKEIEITWPIIVSRILVASTFALLGTYAASKGSKHRKTESINRQLVMELASIDLYLSGLPDSTKDKLKENLAERYFGRFEKLEGLEPHPIPQVEICKELINKMDPLILKELLSPQHIKDILSKK